MPPVNRIDEARVLELLRQGCTRTQICRRLGINKSSVSVIARRVFADAELAASIRGEDEDRLRRQIASHKAQKPRHYPDGHSEPGPWQENAIRIMEDRE
jgi:hypothetical protein